MQNTLFVPCFILFIFVMMPLSILAHELGHSLAMIRLHRNGKPIIICIGCKMTFDPKTGKYHRPASSWIIRWRRLLLIVAPVTKAAFFGITYGQEKLNTLQRFRMILGGPLASLGLTLIWSTGAWLLFTRQAYHREVQMLSGPRSRRTFSIFAAWARAIMASSFFSPSFHSRIGKASLPHHKRLLCLRQAVMATNSYVSGERAWANRAKK